MSSPPAKQDSDLWQTKAMAFVTRSHRHLWGKNNEDPLAFLFQCGLKNRFAKQILLGWNKFGQYRPRKNWGLEKRSCRSNDPNSNRLFLPPGIVIPSIIKKNLVAVFIVPYEGDNPTTWVAGGKTPTMILGDLSGPVIVTDDLLHGLFIFQETGEKTGVIVHPVPDLPLDIELEEEIRQHMDWPVFLSPHTKDTLKKTGFKQIPKSRIQLYRNKEEMLSLIGPY